MVVWLGQFPAPDPMSEDERLELLRTATEAHADLSELALRLRRHLTPKAPATRSSMSSGCGAARIASASAEKILKTAPEARMGR